MKRLGLFAIALCVWCSTATAAELVSRIAAVVNDDIITTYQLDQALQEQLARQGRQPSPGQIDVLRRELLNRLIEETLVKQRIQTLNLTVSEEEIETAILDVQKQNKLTRQELEKAVLNQGISFENYRDNLRQQILRYKLIGADVRSKVDVTEQEIVEYYRAHLVEYRYPGEMVLSALSFPVPTASDEFQREAVLLAARQATERLRQGDSLDTVVATFRQEYGAKSFDLGSLVVGEISPEFSAALEPVSEGGYSDPVLSGDAIHVLLLHERKEGGLRPFEAAKGEIYQLISDQKTDAQLKEWTKGLERQAFIDIRL